MLQDNLCNTTRPVQVFSILVLLLNEQESISASNIFADREDNLNISNIISLAAGCCLGDADAHCLNDVSRGRKIALLSRQFSILQWNHATIASSVNIQCLVLILWSISVRQTGLSKPFRAGMRRAPAQKKFPELFGFIRLSRHLRRLNQDSRPKIVLELWLPPGHLDVSVCK